jgi:hypothetical protein
LLFGGKVEHHLAEIGREQAPGGDASSRSALRPAAPKHRSKANETATEQSDGRRLWYGDFGDHDLAVAGLEIGDQDLVGADIEGATATTRTRTGVAATATSATAIAAAAAATSISSASPTAEATGKTEAPTREIRECPTASAAAGGVTSAAITEKAPAPASAAARAKHAATTTVAADSPTAPAPAGAAVRHRKATSAGEADAPRSAAATATTGDDQRHIAGTDYETAATAAAAESAITTRTADCNL